MHGRFNPWASGDQSGSGHQPWQAPWPESARTGQDGQPYEAAPPQQQPAHQQPAYDDPRYAEPAYQEPAYQEGVYQEPAYREPGYDHEGYDDPRYHDPRYGEPAYDQAPYDQPAYDQAPYHQAPYDQPAYDQPRDPDRAWSAPEPVRAGLPSLTERERIERELTAVAAHAVPGGTGRRSGRGLPGPIGLAVLVTALLVALGVGAAMLPASFARGDGDAGTAQAGPGEQAAPGDAAPEPVPVPSPEPSPSPTAAPSPSPTKAAAASPKPRRSTAKPKPKQSTTKPSTSTGNKAVEDQVTALVNEERAEAGCGSVRANEQLRAAARGHSQDMVNRDYFDHTSPDGRTPWDRAEAAGYDNAIGENIAKGQPDAEAVMQAWMDSPGHRQNILNCSAKAIGVGLAYDGRTPVWTQMFGSV